MHRYFAPLQPRVAGQGPASTQQQVLVTFVTTITGLAWPYYFHLMAALPKPFAQVAKGIGHTVDLGWEGFTDKGDAKGWHIHDKKFPPASLRSCDDEVTHG